MTVPLVFTPSGAGPRAGTLKVTASGKTFSFSMGGAGQAVGPKLEVSPPVVTFGGTIDRCDRLRNGAHQERRLDGDDRARTRRPRSALPPRRGAAEQTGTEPGSVRLDRLLADRLWQLRRRARTADDGRQRDDPPQRDRRPGGAAEHLAPDTDFGQVTVGGEATRSFAITNSGGLPVENQHLKAADRQRVPRDHASSRGRKHDCARGHGDRDRALRADRARAPPATSGESPAKTRAACTKSSSAAKASPSAAGRA